MSLTVKSYHEILYEERKSKFYGFIKPILNLKEAQNFIFQISKENSQATHNVYAYRVQDDEGVHVKAYDDGEPKNTAGKPILDILNHNDLSNVVIVVSRYFGGIKLGAGGLIRAYASAAKKVIEENEKVPIEKHVDFMIEFDYMLVKTVDNFLISHGISDVEKGFRERVIFKFSASEELQAALKEIQGVSII
ncbi:MAG: YigZ family protein [Fusobacteria bacterium]|nr:YigZ family protein [Fusobacteriota bacterium]